MSLAAFALVGLLGGTLGGGDAELGSALSLRPDQPEYWVYVTAESSDEVYVVRFDGSQAVVEQKITVGRWPTEIEGPHGLTVDESGEHWYLSMAHGNPYGTLYKYTTGDNEMVGEVPLGLFPATMQISPATGLLYCVNFDLHGDMTPSSVSIVDPESMDEVARTTTGSMPHGSRISPDGLRHYSCAMMSGELYEMDAVRFEISRVLNFERDLGGRTVMGKVHVPGAVPRLVDPRAEEQSSDEAPHGVTKPTWVIPHPQESFVYVALNGANELVEVDLESWKVSRRFKTDKGPYNVEIAPDGRHLVVTYKGAGAVGLWDLLSESEKAHCKTSRRVTHGVVLSPDSRYAFVSCEGIGGEAGTVDVLDVRAGKIVATAEVGLQAGGMAFWKMEAAAAETRED